MGQGLQWFSNSRSCETVSKCQVIFISCIQWWAHDLTKLLQIPSLKGNHLHVKFLMNLHCKLKPYNNRIPNPILLSCSRLTGCVSSSAVDTAWTGPRGHQDRYLYPAIRLIHFWFEKHFTIDRIWGLVCFLLLQGCQLSFILLTDNFSGYI